MNPLTYLGFTIFSIIMQFCVMEFIHERFQIDKDTAIFNETINNKNDPIYGINQKPHALFYRTETDKTVFETDNNAEETRYKSVDDSLTTTDISSTTFEIYYENTSIIDDFFTTESYSTTSEFDNVTEITLLDKNNTTTAKPGATKRVTSKNCFCNLLYQKCDINCCCDTECSEVERSLFINCIDDCGKAKTNGMHLCNSYPTCRSSISSEMFNDLFCVSKVNLPEKRIKSHFQMDTATINTTFKWNSIKKPDITLHYKKKKYVYGDSLWLLKNGAASSLNLPTTTTNYYCNGQKQLLFLENESIKCYVKIRDLYMFTALKTLEGTKLISSTDLSMNTTVLNCSTLHCTNWTILACIESICDNFNETVHAPTCTESYCSYVSHTIEYTFYYFESKIINATLKIYMNKIPINIPLVMQKVTVRWYLGNESIDDVIQLSGNPGYIYGLPVIVSPATNNHTDNFYNQTYGKSVVSFPGNVRGQCNWSSVKNKALVFGLNTRLKCRLNILQNFIKNATRACQAVQTNIKEELRLNQILFISPYGNPRDVSDDKWIQLEVNDRTLLYGEYRSKNSQLVCYNLGTRFSFIIAYADTSDLIDREEYKIVKASVDVTYSNVTFGLPELSTILTIDVRFIDVSNPIIEFARAPNLNIHFPVDFFFDYPSNGGYRCIGGYGGYVLVSYWCLLLTTK